MTANPMIEPLEAALLEMGIQGRKIRDLRKGHQEVAPGIAHQALHFALVIALSGPAKAVTKEIV